MTPTIAVLMAEYNQWMNTQIYTAAAQLPSAELVADKRAFFGSILGTLNHIAVGDTIWLRRFVNSNATSEMRPDIALLPMPTSLRDTIAPDLPALRAYRVLLDSLICQWARGLTINALSANLSYVNRVSEVRAQNLGAIVQHFFNHQTHHRGQVSTLLFQSGIDIGTTDLMALIPNSDA